MSETKVHDVVIVGSGPAGYTAAIYAARAQFMTCDHAHHQRPQTTQHLRPVARGPGRQQPHAPGQPLLPAGLVADLGFQPGAAATPAAGPRRLQLFRPDAGAALGPSTAEHP